MRKQEFNSKLISLLPLDEVPVHVPLRRPRPLRLERLPVPVWNPYSRGRLSPAKSEDRKGGEGKADANLTIFLSTYPAGWGTPTRPPRPGEALHPAPSARKSATRTAQKTALCAPASTQEVSDPKIGQQLGAQPTPGFRVILLAEIDVKIDAMIDVEIDSRSGRSLVSIPN